MSEADTLSGSLARRDRLEKRRVPPIGPVTAKRGEKMYLCNGGKSQLVESKVPASRARPGAPNSSPLSMSSGFPTTATETGDRTTFSLQVSSYTPSIKALPSPELLLYLASRAWRASSHNVLHTVALA